MALRKERQFFDFSQYVPDRDYKMEYVEQELQRDFESVEKWLYLGADSLDRTFVKVGMTVGDLRSRSYSSSRPSYFLFCAFKCKDKLSRADIKIIEKDVLSRIDWLHRNPDGSSKRMRHFESGAISECFSSVDFLEFYRDVHDAIYDHHRNNFVISGWVNEFGVEDGEFVDCIFNENTMNDYKAYMRKIIRYD
ncbi:MAG: hypothetical protein ACN6PE_23155 [Achromobacter marplatensis]|uniref:hypothetical protein n=1 Tax=Achromobacter marplatensis TaxID=470868 RepID=UPI003D00CBC7